MLGLDTDKINLIIAIAGALFGFGGGITVIISTIYKKIVKPISVWTEKVNSSIETAIKNQAEMTAELKVNGGASIKDAVNDIRNKTNLIYDGMQRLEVRSYLDPQPMFECNIHGEAIYFNRSMLYLLGQSKEESVGYGWMGCIIKEDYDKISTQWETLIKGQEFVINFSLKNKINQNILEVSCVAHITRTSNAKFIVCVLEEA